MALRVHRSFKLLPGIRLNIRKRDASTSIGVRRAHVTLDKAATRTTVGLPGSRLSYTHMETSRVVGFVAPASNPVISSAPPGRDWRELLWIALIIFAVAAAAAQATK
jgi:Protein of unknown function (DUF4236)